MIQKVLRRTEVERLTGLKRSTIYAAIQRGAFPAPIPIGAKSVAWLEHEVSAWQAAHIAKRDATNSSRVSNAGSHRSAALTTLSR